MFSKLKSFAGQEEPHKNEQSLATILPTVEDRTNLLLLVTGSIEQMRRLVLDIFDPTKTNETKTIQLQDKRGTAEQGASQHAGSKEFSTVAEDQPADQGGERAHDPNVDQQPVDDPKQRLEQRQKELCQPEIVDLRRAALARLDDWGDRVLQRVGEAINRRDNGDKKDSQRISADSSQLKRGTSATRNHYSPLDTPLSNLDEAHRVLVLHSILLLLLGLETYSAESRVLMLRITASLKLSDRTLADDETAVAKGLLEVAKQQMNADAETKKKSDENSMARKVKVGLGAAAGAVLIGVTGGLAAPLLAAGVGTVMGGIGLGATAAAGYLGALAGSAPLVGVLFGAYGARMTGQMVDEYAKDVEDFAFIPIKKPSLFHGHGEKSPRSLRVAIAISGWLTEDGEVVQPWQVMSGHGTEAFALRWELKALLNLGNAISTYVKSYAWGWAKKEIISRTIFATLSSALALPYGLAKAARVVDNPFSVAKSRSDKAGAVLADALINKVQGERPVTLIGYSLGARVIYACLRELADRQAFGLVEAVCLAGAPVPSDPLAWRKIRSVVSGRIVNAYSTKDYLLAFLYRTGSLQYGVAGLQAMEEVQGIENLDVSELVDGHTQYRFLIGTILHEADLEAIDVHVLEQQVTRYRREEEEAKKDEELKSVEGNAVEAEAESMEKEVQEKTAGRTGVTVSKEAGNA